MADKVILWDFDGTLAYREGLWSGCLAEVIADVAPDLGLTRDDVRPFLQKGFPWDRADEPHLELCDPEAWWAPMEDLLAGVAVSLGVPEDRARECAHQTRLRYIDGTGFRLFDDVVPVLSSLRDEGWSHVILSNHVPELEAIVEAVRLRSLVTKVFTSALTGYEKPHPEAFRIRARRVATHVRSG